MFGPLDPVSEHSTASLPIITISPYCVLLPLCLFLTHIFSGLFFTCRALQHAQEDTDAELRVCFKRAYDVVLRHHHSFVIRSVVSVSDPHGFILPPFHPLGSSLPDAGGHSCCTPSR